jgi:hypothetical protein
MPAVADTAHVITGALGLTRLVCCGLVIASFAMFAVDQVGGASRHQVAELATGAQTRTGTSTVIDTNPGQPRRFIDGAARALTSPFRSMAHFSSQWAEEGFVTLGALLLYGVGLGYLARFSQGSTSSRYRPSPHS